MDVFCALADPTRRQILTLLSQAPVPIHALAAHFPVSRPAISRHVKLLISAGLVQVKHTGRERYCHLKAEPLQEVVHWLRAYENFWQERLDALEAQLARLPAQSH